MSTRCYSTTVRLNMWPGYYSRQFFVGTAGKEARRKSESRDRKDQGRTLGIWGGGMKDVVLRRDRRVGQTERGRENYDYLCILDLIY